MKLNFDIICDSLQNEYPLVRYGTARTDLHIIAPRFYAGESSADYIYLLDTEEIPEEFQAPVIKIGTECSVPEDIDFPVAVVCADIPVKELMNVLLNVFEQFRRWDETLQECVEKGFSLQELTALGAAKIGCRILICDKRLVLLSDSLFYHEPSDAPLNYQGETLPTEIIQIFSEDTAKLQKLHEPYLIGEDGRYEERCIYNINIFFGDRYEGTCSLMEESRKFRVGDFALFSHFFQYAYRQFQFFYGTTGKQSQALRSIIKAVLEHKQMSTEMERAIAPYGDIHDSFRCLVLSAADESVVLDGYLCFSIERIFNESISLVHDNKVVAFIPQVSRTDLNMLFAVIRPLEFYIGFSNSGKTIHEILSLYLQAMAALDIGIRKNPGQQIHMFADYALDYLMEHSAGEFSVDTFKTEGFRRLESLNAESTVDYIYTLRVYLEQEMNISESARRLYLHRSSFLKRLERIREIMGNELETPEGRLLLRCLLYHM